MTNDDAEALASVLRAALEGASDELCAEGWTLAGVAPRFLMGKHLPVVSFRREADSLCFIVTPNDPAERVFKRGPRYDVTYFSEDVPDDQQSQIYRRDRAQIERVAAWVCRHR